VGKISNGQISDIVSSVRINIINMLYRAGSGHPGGSLSEVEILIALYFGAMKIDPEHPDDETRDRFILSKGHASPGLYAVLAERGFFDKAELNTLRQIGSILQGHPDMKKTPGVDFSTGSLGQGLSVGCGMALGAKLKGLKSRIYVLLGDGELNEGQVWEAAMSAVKFKLDNLTAIVDRNHVQLDGTADDIMPMDPLSDKWKSFNWHVFNADGHDVGDMLRSIDEAIKIKDGRPSVIIAETIKGKGVSFMENDYRWHGKIIDGKEYETALYELGRGDKQQYE